MEVLEPILEPLDGDEGDWKDRSTGGNQWGSKRPPLRLVVLDESHSGSDLRQEFPEPTAAVKRLFGLLAEEWTRESEFVSVQSRAIALRPYQRIIAIGPAAVRPLLRRLRDRPDQWFWALSVLTNDDPAADLDTFDESRVAWLEWGAYNDLLD